MLMSARLHGDEKGQSRVPQHRSRNFTPDIWPLAFTEMLKITLKVLYLLRRLMVPSSPGRCGEFCNHSLCWNQSLYLLSH